MNDSAIANALKLQAANVTQKALLDMLVTKVIHTKTILRISRERGPRIVRGHAADLAEAMGEIERVLQLDRDETKALRAAQFPEFPDDRIQAIIDRAANEIRDVLLEGA